MKHFKNFTLYTPVDEKGIRIPGYQPYYIRDSKGIDWYDAQKQFSDDCLKVFYGEDGMIKALTISGIDYYFPVDMSVVEVKTTDENLAIKADGTWFYKDGKLQQIRDYVAIARAERDRLMSEATKRIEWLAAALEDGDISEDEQAELAALRTYRGVLRRLDLSKAPDIEWPEKPTSAG